MHNKLFESILMYYVKTKAMFLSHKYKMNELLLLNHENKFCQWKKCFIKMIFQQFKTLFVVPLNVKLYFYPLNKVISIFIIALVN